jgi:hypothetical protein
MYEETFGTDWEEISGRKEAVNRAFALGVAAKLGAEHPGELDRINDAVDTSYEQSFVELAYHEGRDKAAAVDTDDDERIWGQLVEGETEIDPDARPEPGFEADNSLPGLVNGIDIDTLPPDTLESLQRPGFLDRESETPPDQDGGERTMFGRRREHVSDDGQSEGTSGPSRRVPQSTETPSDDEEDEDEELADESGEE